LSTNYNNIYGENYSQIYGGNQEESFAEAVDNNYVENFDETYVENNGENYNENYDEDVDTVIDADGTVSVSPMIGAGRKKPGRVFSKYFFITFLIAVIIFAALIALAMSLLDSTPMSKQAPVAQPPIKTEEKLDILIPAEGMMKKEFKDTKRVNILLLGNTEEELTDTMMLASFDPESKDVSVISIPRDTFYEREGYYGAWLKINAVFHDGVYESAMAVHNVLQGIHINYYAIIDYDGIKEIVDSMGGVEIDVPQRMYYTSKKHNLYINLKPGLQVLDGDHAVQFIRYRKGYRDGDLGRVKAQQEFMKASFDTAMSNKLPKVADTVLKNVDSDISVRAILYMLKESDGVEMSKVRTFILPGDDGYIGNLSFFTMAEDFEIEAMLRVLYDQKTYPTTESAITAISKTTDSAVEPEE